MNIWRLKYWCITNTCKNRCDYLIVLTERQFSVIFKNIPTLHHECQQTRRQSIYSVFFLLSLVRFSLSPGLAVECFRILPRQGWCSWSVSLKRRQQKTNFQTTKIHHTNPIGTSWSQPFCARPCWFWRVGTCKTTYIAFYSYNVSSNHTATKTASHQATMIWSSIQLNTFWYSWRGQGFWTAHVPVVLLQLAVRTKRSHGRWKQQTTCDMNNNPG